MCHEARGPPDWTPSEQQALIGLCPSAPQDVLYWGSDMLSLKGLARLLPPRHTPAASRRQVLLAGPPEGSIQEPLGSSRLLTT